ncbi:MAG TPA: glutaredoxin family protein [Thermoleophilia bacterium]|nr:glutaredoxin family protein [Thermoleophilia bacterium]
MTHKREDQAESALRAARGAGEAGAPAAGGSPAHDSAVAGPVAGSSEAKVELSYYSAPDCHLCEIGLAHIARLADELGLSVRVVDISSGPDLEGRYRSRIPVGEIQGRVVFKYQVDEDRLRRLVEWARVTGESAGAMSAGETSTAGSDRAE